MNALKELAIGLLHGAILITAAALSAVIVHALLF